jgi:hypothetical protein
VSNLTLKKKDDIVIKLTECLDKSISFNYLNNTPIESRSVNHGWILALKWALGYDELHKQSNDSVPEITGDKNTDALLEDERIAQDEIDMNKL